MRKSQKVLAAACGGVVLMSAVQSVHATFTSGSLVVFRVGAGVTTASPAYVPFNASYLAQSIYLDEYNATTGALIASHPVPSSSINSSYLTLTSKSDDHDGHLNLSANGQYLTFGGYRAQAGDAYPVAATSTAVPRALGVFDGNWNFNSTTISNSYTGTTITAVASDNGQQFWSVGGQDTNTVGGLKYISAIGAAPVNVSKDLTGTKADSFRNARIVNGDLIINTASQTSYTNPDSTGGRGAWKLALNGGLPIAITDTASTATRLITDRETYGTDLDGNPDTSKKGSLYPKSDSIFLDLNNDGTPDTLYATGGKNDISKWHFDGTKWTHNETTDQIYFPSISTEVNALDYYINGSTISLLASTDSGIYKINDTGGTGGFVAAGLTNLGTYNQVFGTSAFITATDNTQFRGLAVVPEPSGMFLLAGTALFAVKRRQRGMKI